MEGKPEHFDIKSPGETHMGSQDTAETKHTILPVTKKIYLVQACSEKQKQKQKQKQTNEKTMFSWLFIE